MGNLAILHSLQRTHASLCSSVYRKSSIMYVLEAPALRGPWLWLRCHIRMEASALASQAPALNMVKRNKICPAKSLPTPRDRLFSKVPYLP